MVFSPYRWHMGSWSCFTGSSFSKGVWELGLGHLHLGTLREVEWWIPMLRWTHQLPFCLLPTEEIEVGNSCPLLVFMICYYFSGSGKHTDLSLKLYHEICSLRNLGTLWEEIVQVTICCCLCCKGHFFLTESCFIPLGETALREKCIWVPPGQLRSFVSISTGKLG